MSINGPWRPSLSLIQQVGYPKEKLSCSLEKALILPIQVNITGFVKPQSMFEKLCAGPGTDS